MVKQKKYEPRTTPADVKSAAGEVMDRALVRVEDGRLGVLRHNRKAGDAAVSVVFMGGEEVPVAPDETVTIWMRPDQAGFLLRDILVGRLETADLGEMMAFVTPAEAWQWWGKRLAEAETADLATVALGKLCEIFPAATDIWMAMHAQRLEILAKAREMVAADKEDTHE